MWAKIVKKYIHRRKTTPFFSTGFTLIEIMVAVSIFVIVAFIVTSTLLVVLDANRRANAWRSIMENVNFAIDSMSYKIKFGREYVIMNDLGNPVTTGTRISFLDRNQNRLEYCRRSFEVNGLPKMAIYRCNFGAGTGDCLTGSACQPITSTDIDVIEMKMTESACNPIYCPINPALRNRAVVIMVRAEVTVKGETSQLDFQTTVAQSQSQ